MEFLETLDAVGEWEARKALRRGAALVPARKALRLVRCQILRLMRPRNPSAFSNGNFRVAAAVREG